LTLPQEVASCCCQTTTSRNSEWIVPRNLTGIQSSHATCRQEAVASMDELSQRPPGFTDGWRCSVFEVLETGPGTALENLSQVQQPKASVLARLLLSSRLQLLLKRHLASLPSPFHLPPCPDPLFPLDPLTSWSRKEWTCPA
jgi:hypothetical protein